MGYLRYLPPMFRGQVRDLRLRGFSSRTREEVRATLLRGTSLVERVLKHHAAKDGHGLPADWEKLVRRAQIQGDGRNVPELVSYDYGGEEVLTVWTYVESDVLHILVRRSRTTVFQAHQPYASAGWSELSWTAGVSGV